MIPLMIFDAFNASKRSVRSIHKRLSQVGNDIRYRLNQQQGVEEMMTKKDWDEWRRYCDERNSIYGEMVEWERRCNTFHGHIVPIGKDAKEKPWMIGIWN